MLQESLDLRAEATELHAFLESLDPEDWGRATRFMQWTPWDVIAHLHYFDLFSLYALEGIEIFGTKRDEFIQYIRAGLSPSEIARREFGKMAPAELLRCWQETCFEMSTKLGVSDPALRMPWFGPNMGVRMFTTARYMETWAHGQEIYDLMQVERTHTDRIKNVATLGVRTFGWTFVNRGLEVPDPVPYVRLSAPSGEIWEWNEAHEHESIRGDAIDFCQVVTQGRNIADTRLEVRGEIARRWMSMAQCFAGGPVDPPEPGQDART